MFKTIIVDQYCLENLIIDINLPSFANLSRPCCLLNVSANAFTLLALQTPNPPVRNSTHAYASKACKWQGE
jgi:hypothetical protein